MVSRKSESVTGQPEAPWQPPPGELRSARQQVAEPQSADPHARGLPPGPHGEGCPHSRGPQARPSVPDPQTGPGGGSWAPRARGGHAGRGWGTLPSFMFANRSFSW